MNKIDGVCISKAFNNTRVTFYRQNSAMGNVFRSPTMASCLRLRMALPQPESVTIVVNYLAVHWHIGEQE